MAFLYDARHVFYSQFFVTPALPKSSCEGKTVIVTGANVGLGYEAAKHFVRLGAEKVILGCRSVEKGQTAAEAIEREEHRTGVVEVWQLDLSKYESVEQFAKKVDGLKRIDMIIENAGIATEKFSKAEADESTITVNVVSTFLLALLALPALKRTAETYSITPTLTIVSSDVHFFVEFPERNAQTSIFEALSDSTKANMSERYHVSKLLEILVVRELCQTQISRPYPVTINTPTPGFCYSELVREAEGTWRGTFYNIMKRLVARTTEVGSRTLVLCGLAGQETHGEWMVDGKPARTSSFTTSEEGKKVGARVWKELSEKLEAIHPGILRNL
ncbi:hypothetical protein AAFC00_003691 [Neodothiora populina]|uniref:NAD(P)-binding protein n=1 Tax=Neodothiora populina TaxID=2781224 RepID=A0ABR3PF26_9PEZI